MKVKISLHLHSNEDPQDGPAIKYSIYELIDRAAALGFKVLASTAHAQSVCRPEHIKYAGKKGILLISGVEVEMENHGHMLILNGGKQADQVASFRQLKIFKKQHPESFIIAPHPNHGMGSSIGLKELLRLKGTVDAVEYSWYYSKLLNPNSGTREICKKMDLPLIATCDAHVLDYLNTDYAVVNLNRLTIEAVFVAIRKGKFINVTRPKKIRELLEFMLYLALNDFMALLKSGGGKKKAD